MSKTTRILAYTATALAGTLYATQTLAGAFALREQSAYYQGMSFAGNGTTGPSVSSVFWNPATITGVGDGFTIELHGSLIIPESDLTGTFTSNGIIPGVVSSSAPAGDIANDAFVPSTYAAYKFNDKLYIGLAVNSPFGLATKPDQNWAGQFYSRSSEVFSINANPIIGYKINEMFSVAVGLQVQYLDVNLKSAFPNALLGFPSAMLSGDGTGFGATAGVTFTPMEGTEIGLGYRSAIGYKLEGDLNVPGAPGTTTPITTKLMTPDMVTLSAKQRITDKFRVLGTVEWTNWSRLKNPVVRADPSGVALQTLHFNYDDGWFFSIGGEYDYNERLTLRAGVGYELSPIDDDIRSTRLPDADRLWLSAGLSYNVLDNLSFDLGYSYIFAADADINIVPGHQDYNPLLGSFVGSADANVNIISASLRYRWGGPTGMLEEPIVTKY